MTPSGAWSVSGDGIIATSILVFTMTIKEQITAEIESLHEEDLNELFDIIKNFVQTKSSSQPSTQVPSLMSRLRKIKIDGPADFSTNLVQYMNGEKTIE